MHCTVCENGFINLHQIPEAEYAALAASRDPTEAILQWIKQHDDYDVAVCHCCGDGEGEWDSEPGTHEESDYGPDGPFASNGGLPLCF